MHALLSKGRRIFLARDAADAGTPASTTETVLKTYTLPAGYVNANSTKRVRICAWGTNAANASVKTLRLRLGLTTLNGVIGITLGGGTVFNATSFRWWLEGSFAWRAAASQDGMFWGTVDQSGAIGAELVSRYIGTEADNATFLIEVTGQNGTATLNDIVCNGWEVELLP